MNPPDRAFLNKTHLSDYLEIDERTIDKLVSDGVLPGPIVRPGEKRPVWDNKSAWWCAWRLTNPGRFSKDVSTPDSSA